MNIEKKPPQSPALRSSIFRRKKWRSEGRQPYYTMNDEQIELDAIASLSSQKNSGSLTASPPIFKIAKKTPIINIEIALTAISLATSGWLINSLAKSDGGHFLSYVMAGAFDLTPLLLVGAAIKSEWRALTAKIIAFLIFMFGFTVFTAPEIQSLVNQWTTYKSDILAFEKAMDDYTKQKAIKDELTKNAESSYNHANSEYYKSVIEGNNVSRKRRERDKKLAAWQEAQTSLNNLTPPEKPNISDEIKNAIVELAKRLGMFFSAFAAMSVRRTLKIQKEEAQNVNSSN